MGDKIRFWVDGQLGYGAMLKDFEPALEEGWVKPIYCDVNSIRKRKYERAIDTNYLRHWILGGNCKIGEIVFYTPPNCLLSKVLESQKDRQIASLLEENRALKIENRGLKVTQENITESPAKAIATLREMDGKSGRSPILSPDMYNRERLNEWLPQ